MKLKQIPVAIALVAMAAACAPATSVPGNGAGSSGDCPRWAVGDSFTTGIYDIPGWPDQDPPIPAGTYVNKGVGGATIAQLSSLMANDLSAVAPEDMPCIIVFHAGANDIANFNLAQVTLQANLAAAVDIALSYGVDIRVVPVLPIPSWADWVVLNSKRRVFNEWMEATYPTRFLDCATPLYASNGVYLEPAYALGDRVHLNDLGFEVLAGCIDGSI